MSENVLPFTGTTTLPSDPAETLEKAKSWGMKKCLILGEGENGELIIGSSFSEVDGLNTLCDMGKQRILAEINPIVVFK